MLERALASRGGAFGGVVLIAVVLMAILAPFLAPYDPLKQDLSGLLAPPNPQHLLGTDNNGRDVLSRVMWGTRISLVAGLVSVALALLIGCLIGLSAGYWGGWLDGGLM